ncbi:MAG: hypothetical protein AAFU03_03495, partial [Bacteroidota bacterium]
LEGVLRLNHLIEQMALRRGVPQLVFISGVEQECLLAVRELVKGYRANGGEAEEIDFIIYSYGGHLPTAYRIIRYLREKFTRVNAIIPFLAKSSATLMALGCTQIVFGECGELGPLDTQIGTPGQENPNYRFHSALNDESSLRLLEERSMQTLAMAFDFVFNQENIPINKSLLFEQLLQFCSEFYDPLVRQLNPHNLGYKSRALQQALDYARKTLMQFQESDEWIENGLAEHIVLEYANHGFVIDYYTIRAFLSNVLRTQELGEEYALLLDDLTDIFLEFDWEDEENEMIGLIDVPDPDAANNSEEE